MRGRQLVLGAMLTIGLLGAAPPTAAHPLGNATVSRALAVELRPGEARITTVLDLAEIPAFAAMLEIDADGDGDPSAGERTSWAGARCRTTAAAIRLELDGLTVQLAATEPAELSFPAGVGGLATRHDSMAAGELGADYVLFGEPDANGQRPSVEAIAERLQWWDELFEPPCTGFAVSREEAFELARAGADFVLVGDFIWADPRGARAASSTTSPV